ncbi:MAG: DinB family protein [Ilumatobacteraceae bacterium]|jgi:hypothetical protein|nr:DinB family protein [Ilumatobacteraceae bacterium]
MEEEFEGQDLQRAVFWGCDLRGAHFRDVDLSGVTVSHALLVDVDIDGVVDRVSINGVDVTAYVNEHDRWYPLRAVLRASDVDEMRAGWRALDAAWRPVVERARALPDGAAHRSVAGEWSFVETLRHLVFALDKWWLAPVLGATGFHPIGISNSGSADFGWPGVDPSAMPTLADAAAVLADHSARFSESLDGIESSDLDREVEVLENGTETVRTCVLTVLEEAFHHLRYAVRDLDRLTGGA